MTEFKAENPPKIYYDRKFLFHLTQPEGCRYKCIFTNELQFLGRGDAAVFSDSYPPERISEIKKRSVIITDMFNTHLAKSMVPYLYPMFWKSTHPETGFTQEEKVAIETKNSTKLLPVYHKNRKNSIAWVVSNFNAHNNRVEFAHSISQFIPVDIYGARNKPLPRKGNPFEYVSRRNKFYLAFENSNCRNYITEKVTFNALQHDMVPIVLGAYKEDYEAVLPPHSYINVDDFKTIRELTDYIKYLDRNDTAYAKYLTWKEYGKIIDPIRMDCRLCGFLYHLRSGKIKISRSDPRDFVDPKSVCFYRPLLPTE
ncbi:hypothetical protein ACTXT7_005900 [Hymenolepis weldensis]